MYIEDSRLAQLSKQPFLFAWSYKSVRTGHSKRTAAPVYLVARSLVRFRQLVVAVRSAVALVAAAMPSLELPAPGERYVRLLSSRYSRLSDTAAATSGTAQSAVSAKQHSRSATGYKLYACVRACVCTCVLT